MKAKQACLHHNGYTRLLLLGRPAKVHGTLNLALRGYKAGGTTPPAKQAYLQDPLRSDAYQV